MRSAPPDVWFCVSGECTGVPAAYSRTFPRMTLVIWRREHRDREWETLRSGCLVLTAHAILSKTQTLADNSGFQILNFGISVSGSWIPDSD